MGSCQCTCYYFMKWFLFVACMLFFFIGVGLVYIGIWVNAETQSLSSNTIAPEETQTTIDKVLDVSVVFIVTGVLILIPAFLGAVGALREYKPLLITLAVWLGLVILMEIIMAIIVLTMTDKLKKELSELLKDEAVRDYRDSINRQNLVDWFQETFECCGADGYKDWGANRYFDCDSIGFEGCSVPYSCCRNPYTYDADTVDTRCGSDALRLSRIEASVKIYTVGCVEKAEQTISINLGWVAVVALVVVIPQIAGVIISSIFARNITKSYQV